jgi:hypothetical protein
MSCLGARAARRQATGPAGPPVAKAPVLPTDMAESRTLVAALCLRLA